MATLSRKLLVYSDGSVRVVGPGTLPRDKVFVRVLHELELPPDRRRTPLERPEVRPCFPNHHVPFAKRWQLKSKSINPLCSPGNWTAGYHWRLWVANDNGFGDEGDPRANFVTGKDLTKPLPRVEALTCGGNLLSVIGEIRTKTDTGPEDCYIVETLDWSSVPPETLQPWQITVAVNLGGDRTPRRFEMGTQPNGYIPGFFHPLLADPRRYQVAIQKWRCVRWLEPEPPDPYKVYL